MSCKFSRYKKAFIEMRVGDIVKIRNPFWESTPVTSAIAEVGTILEINHWVNLGPPYPPEGNSGVSVQVAWSSGRIETHSDDELVVVIRGSL